MATARNMIGQGVRAVTTRQHTDRQPRFTLNSAEPWSRSLRPDLSRQRSHEPDADRTSSPCRLARQTPDNQTARQKQGPHHCGDLHAHAQRPLQVGQAYSSAFEGSTTAQSRALHAAAGPRRISRERRSLRGDAGGSARRSWRPRREVSQRRLGSALAGWPGNALLHALSRSPPSRASVYAGASARIPVAKPGDVRIWNWKSCGRSAGRPAAPATIPKESQ